MNDTTETTDLELSLDDPEAGRKAVEAASKPAPRQASTLALLIRDEWQLARSSWVTTLDRALGIGTILLEAKESVGHGSFIGWVNENCPFKYTTATNFMKLAAHKELIQAKYSEAEDLTLAAALRLVSEGKTKKQLEQAAGEPQVEVIPPAPSPAGQQIRVKGYGAGQDLHRLEATGEDEGGTLRAYEGFDPAEDEGSTNGKRLTCAPNMPITDRDEPGTSARGVHRESAPRASSTAVLKSTGNDLEDEYQAWRTSTAQLIRNALAAGRGDYRATMHVAINNYFEMNSNGA